MAYKDSDELQANENYALGEYSFRIERTSVPGSTNDKIEAICAKGGKNARKSVQVPSSTQMSGWYVEANDATADVYAVVKVPAGGGGSGDVPGDNPFDIDPFSYSSGSYFYGWQEGSGSPPQYYYQLHQAPLYAAFLGSATAIGLVVASKTPYTDNWEWGLSDTQAPGTRLGTGTNPFSLTYTYNEKTVYYEYGPLSTDVRGFFTSLSPQSINVGVADNAGKIAWLMAYDGATEYEEKTMLVGRFVIELEDAGGVGPGSDWVDPGDWNEDPTTTLHLVVDGALSGRHNDPLNDTSYSYIPSDKATVKDYGCGGDGGNGGGGGAGASSIVVYKFATDKANSKEIVCKPKRHGYGSGGGKGGKGGDGCILVYY